MATNSDELKMKIQHFAYNAGADLIGFASVERWNEVDEEIPPEFRPGSLWSPARTVIVLGVNMPLPIVETTPSILHKETYDTANRVLDALAFNLVRFLNREGFASSFFTRDGYGSLSILKNKPTAAFSHITAAKYAGLGTVGMSNCLLTPEFGPRVRFVSVFTAAVLTSDPMITDELCIQCGACTECCPVKAISAHTNQIKGDFDLDACIDHHIELSQARAYPCGICTKVCPIGRDRLLYPQQGILEKYRREQSALAADPHDPEYEAWTHMRNYGSKLLPKKGNGN